MENKNKLIIEFEKIAHGCTIRIIGKDRTIPWARYVEQAMPSIVESLKSECHEPTEEEVKESRENLIKAMASLADKSVDEVKKELKKMKGDENVNVAKLSAEYLSKAMKKMSKRKK